MPHRGPIRPFTPRENEIAEGIRLGLSYAQIGAGLVNLRTGKRGISEHTVDAHVERMVRKFDLYGELHERLPPRHIILVYAAERFLASQLAPAPAGAPAAAD